MKKVIFIMAILAQGCATKKVCFNGNESFHPILDPSNSCKARVRQVIIGTDVKVPASIALDGGSVNWTYGWAESEFKNGQIELGHMVLKAEPGAKP